MKRVILFVQMENGFFKYNKHVYKNRYGRTEGVYECESCEECPYKNECCLKTSHNQTIHMNQELTSIHQQGVSNPESIHGALLRMNRSIQAEGTFGIFKWDRSYKRLLHRGQKNADSELLLIFSGFNIYKYHNKKSENNWLYKKEKISTYLY